MQDNLTDPHCAVLARRIDDHAKALNKALERTLLDAKAHVAQEAAERLLIQQEQHARAESESARALQRALSKATELEISLERSFEQTSRLAQTLATERAENKRARQQAQILSAWTASAVASREYGIASVTAWGHHRRSIMRKAVCGWRTVARLSRHEAIDSFWGTWPQLEPRPRAAPLSLPPHTTGGNMRNLRTMLQQHYDPMLQEVQSALEVARAETAAALQAKADAEQELKIAFMRAASKLNLEAVSILHGDQR